MPNIPTADKPITKKLADAPALNSLDASVIKTPTRYISKIPAIIAPITLLISRALYHRFNHKRIIPKILKQVISDIASENKTS